MTDLRPSIPPYAQNAARIICERFMLEGDMARTRIANIIGAEMRLLVAPTHPQPVPIFLETPAGYPPNGPGSDWGQYVAPRPSPPLTMEQVVQQCEDGIEYTLEQGGSVHDIAVHPATAYAHDLPGVLGRPVVVTEAVPKGRYWLRTADEAYTPVQPSLPATEALEGEP